MNKMGSIINFTFKNKVRTKSFMITTLILVLLLSIGMNVPYLIKVFKGEDGAKEATQIGVVAEQGFRPAELLLAYTPPAETDAQVEFTAYTSADDAALKQGLEDEKIEGYLTFAPEGSEGYRR